MMSSDNKLQTIIRLSVLFDLGKCLDCRAWLVE